MLATFYHIDIPGIIVWTITSACNASYMFYHDTNITGIIVWTIISNCNTSYRYILPRMYNELLLLPHRYAWENKSVLLSYCSHAYNCIAMQYTYTKCNIKSKQSS